MRLLENQDIEINFIDLEGGDKKGVLQSELINKKQKVEIMLKKIGFLVLVMGGMSVLGEKFGEFK